MLIVSLNVHTLPDKNYLYKLTCLKNLFINHISSIVFEYAIVKHNPVKKLKVYFKINCAGNYYLHLCLFACKSIIQNIFRNKVKYIRIFVW